MDHLATSKAQPPNPTADAVERVIARLDELVRDMRLGHPTHAAVERHADIAFEQADALYAAFRQPRRPVRPPAFLSPDGTKAGW